MRHNFAQFVVVVLLAVAAPRLHAQGRNTVEGKVTADDGSPLGEATVRVDGAAGGASSAADGSYRLTVEAPSGEATVRAVAIGYKPAAQTVTFGGEGPVTADFSMARDPLELDALVVTGVVNPAAKIASSVSITTLDPERIAEGAPRTTSEIFRTIPGVRSEASGGDGNTNITVRGVPISAGGAKYLQLQEDGLPVFLYGDIAFATADQFLRADATVGRVEAIRGGSASTLASNSPAGIINFISKTGDAPGGSIGTSFGLDHNLNRFDFDYGAPAGENLSFHLGGFVRSGEGPRTAGYTALRGGQFKANLTRQFGGGYARIYFKYLDDRVPAYMPMPVQVSGTNANPKWESIPGFSATLGALQSVFLEENVGLNAAGGRRISDVTDGMRSLSRALGAEVSFDLGDGWSLLGRGRVAFNAGRFIAPFTASVGPAATVLAGVGTSINRDLTGATLTFANSGTPFTGTLLQAITLFDTELENFDNTLVDTKVSKTLRNVTLTGGIFNGTQRISMSWLWNNFLMEVAGEDARPVDITTSSGLDLSESGQYSYGVPAFGNCCQVRFNSTYYMTAPYAAFGATAGRLSFDASARWDFGRVTGVGTSGKQATVDVNEDGIIEPIEESVSVIDPTQRHPVDYKYDYPSVSVGANLAMNDDRAVFGRFSHGASAKADRVIFPTGTYTEPIQFGPKDAINQAELGVKQQFKSGGLFVTGFYAKTTEEGGFEATTQKIIKNDYRAFGVEVEGLFDFRVADVRGALTLTDAKITSGDNDGNRPRRQAALMYSVSPSLHFGPHRAGVTVFGQTKAYTQDVNLLALPGYAIVNGFVALGVTSGLRLSAGVNNIFDSNGFTEAEEGQIVEGQVNYIRGRSVTGRSVVASLGYTF